MKCNNFLNFSLSFQEKHPAAKVNLQLTILEVLSFQQGSLGFLSSDKLYFNRPKG